jgi:transcriptional regulator with XRE-family HTH domain
MSSSRGSPDVIRLNVQQLVDQFDDGSTLRASTRIGIPNATLDKILKGLSKNPRVETLHQIAKAYGVGLDFLLTDPAAVRIAPEPERIDVESDVYRSRVLYYSTVRELRLPRDLEEAVTSLAFMLDEFAMALGVFETPRPRTDDGFERARVQEALNFFSALRRAIDTLGAEEVRRRILESDAAVRLRFSPYLEPLMTPGTGLVPAEGLLTPARLANIAKVISASPAWYVQYEGGPARPRKGPGIVDKAGADTEPRDAQKKRRRRRKPR